MIGAIFIPKIQTNAKVHGWIGMFVQGISYYDYGLLLCKKIKSERRINMGQIIESQVAKENWYALLLAIEKKMSGKEALMHMGIPVDEEEEDL